MAAGHAPAVTVSLASARDEDTPDIKPIAAMPATNIMPMTIVITKAMIAIWPGDRPFLLVLPVKSGGFSLLSIDQPLCEILTGGG